MLPHLLSSTSTYVPSQAWKFLATHGASPQSHTQAYSALVALHEQDVSHKVGTLLLEKLKRMPAGEAASEVSAKEQTSKQISSCAKFKLYFVYIYGPQGRYGTSCSLCCVCRRGALDTGRCFRNSFFPNPSALFSPYLVHRRVNRSLLWESRQPFCPPTAHR